MDAQELKTLSSQSHSQPQQLQRHQQSHQQQQQSTPQQMSVEQLNLPPPSPQLCGGGNSGGTGSGTAPASTTIGAGSAVDCGIVGGGGGGFLNSGTPTAQQFQLPPPSDFDSDTELSIVAASAVAAAAAAAAAAITNGSSHPSGGGINSNNNNNVGLNSKQQRQQKRRRERAQRLQAERDNRCTTTTTTVTAGGLLYHASSAGSMGEDSNNSNGNFTSSSNGSNNVLPPTDSIASLLLNPPHSPECNSGLMATPSDSEGESLDEDLLSTSSSSTLLLPRDKPPPRPPPIVRRKLPRSPVLEEEIIDGFAILEFKTYEDLEFAIKLGQKRKEKRLSALEELTCTYSIEETKMPKIIDTGQPHPIRGLAMPMNNNIKEGTNFRGTNNTSANMISMPLTVTMELDAIGAPWKGQYQNNNNLSNNNQNSNSMGRLTATITHHNGNITGGDGSESVGNGNCTNNNDNGDSLLHSVDAIRRAGIHTTATPKEMHSHAPEGAVVLCESNRTIGSTGCISGPPVLPPTTTPTHINSPTTLVGNSVDSISSPQLHPTATVTSTATTTMNDNFRAVMPDAPKDSSSTLDVASGTKCVKSFSIAVNPKSNAQMIDTKMHNNNEGTSPELRGVVPTQTMHQKNVDLKDRINDANNRCNKIGKGFNICDSGNDENKGSEKLGPIVFPSTPTQHVSNATPSPTTPRRSSDYPQQQAIGASATVQSNDKFSAPGVGGIAQPSVSAALLLVNDSVAQCTSSSNANANVSVVGSPSTQVPTSFAAQPPTASVAASAAATAIDLLGPTGPQTAPTAGIKSTNISPSYSAALQIPANDPRSSIASPVSSQPSDGVQFGGPKLATHSAPAGHLKMTASNVAAMHAKALQSNSITAAPILTTSTTATPPSTMGVFGSGRLGLPPPPTNLQQGYVSATVVNTAPKSNEPLTTMSDRDGLKGGPGSIAVNGFLPSFTTPNSGSQLISARISPHGAHIPVPVTPPSPSPGQAPAATTTAAVAASSVPKTPLLITSGPGLAPHNSVATSTLSIPPVIGHNVFTQNNPPSMPGSVTLAAPTASGMLTGVLPSNGIAPMLIHSSPYRAYPNYPLYAPYSGLPHSPYLPPAVPSPGSSPRTSREPTMVPAAAKATGMRPLTPVSSSASGLPPPIIVNSSNSNTGSVPQPPASAPTSHILHHHLPYVAGPNGPSLSVLPAGMNLPGPTPISHNSHSHINSGSSIMTTVYTTASSAVTTTSNNISMPSSFSRDAQLLPPPPAPHLLSHPHLPPPATHMQPMSHLLSHPSQHPIMLRGASPIAANSNNGSASSSSSPSSSSVILKGISPKSESPNKERDPSNHSVPRSQAINTHIGQAVPTTFLGSPAPTTGPPLAAAYNTVSTLHPAHAMPTTTLASMHSIANTPSLPYPPKTSLWPSVSLQMTSPSTATSSASSLSMRPTPPPPILNINTSSPSAATNSVSPQSTHSAGNTSSFQPSYFAAPLPPPPTATTSSPGNNSSAVAVANTVVSTPSLITTASSTPVTATVQSTTPHPFSAESLFQPSKNDQADLLRRELDSRFLDRSGLAAPPPPPSAAAVVPPSTYLRQELHHHQHQHTHLHQHQQLLSAALPVAPPTSGPLFPPLFKDIPKITAVDTPFYRAGIGLPSYSGYSSAGLLHPGLGGPTPFMPPSHLTSFAPKPLPSSSSTTINNPTPTNLDSSKSSKFTKTGRWNAMHVRIAWEIYYHQNKQNPDKLAAGSLAVSGANVSVSQSGGSIVTAGPGLGPSSVSAASLMNMKASPALSLSAGPPPHLMHRPGELPPAAAYVSALPGRSPFETSPLSASFIGAPPSHIGTAVSPFGRYVGPFGFAGLSFGREISLGGALHDPWRAAALQRGVPYHAAAGAPGWTMKPDPALDTARREAEEREREREMREREQRERDRQRREREERERKEKEEKLKREQQEREREKERERERKERERREMERRELERERFLQQQRINESNKLSQVAAAAAAMNAAPRDRSPHRSVGELNAPGGEIRIKEEHVRSKEEQDAMIMRATADPRYLPSFAAAQANAAAAAHHASFMASRHGQPPPHLSRAMMTPTLGGPPMPHFGPPPSWTMDPYRDPYAAMLPMRPCYPLDAARQEEERHKVMAMYAIHSTAHLRAKEPSPIPPPSMCQLGPPLPPPHHRLQQSPLSAPPPPSLAGKPPSLGGLPHSLAVDAMHTTKKEDSNAVGGGGPPAPNSASSSR